MSRSQAVKVFAFMLLVLCVQLVQCAAPYHQYDRSIAVFSPDGDLLQVKYAEEAGNRGLPIACSTAATSSAKEGCAGGDCVVLCIEAAPENALLDRSLLDKVSMVDPAGVWVAFSGLAGDGRAMISLARQLCASYRSKFGSAPTAHYVAHTIGQAQHEMTLHAQERPYGVQMLIVSCTSTAEEAEEQKARCSTAQIHRPVAAQVGDADVQIFHTRASGLVSRWHSIAIGRGAERIMSHLEDEATVAPSTATRSGGIDQPPLASVKETTRVLLAALQGAASPGSDGSRGDGDGDGNGDRRYDLYVLTPGRGRPAMRRQLELTSIDDFNLDV